MTSEEYKEKKKNLEQQVRDLDKQWVNQNKSKYDVNVGKYYKNKKSNNIIGVVSSYNLGEYFCKEITSDLDDVYIDSHQEWSVSHILDSCEFITKEEFKALLNERLKKFNETIDKEFTV